MTMTSQVLDFSFPIILSSMTSATPSHDHSLDFVTTNNCNISNFFHSYSVFPTHSLCQSNPKDQSFNLTTINNRTTFSLDLPPLMFFFPFPYTVKFIANHSNHTMIYTLNNLALSHFVRTTAYKPNYPIYSMPPSIPCLYSCSWT